MHIVGDGHETAVRIGPVPLVGSAVCCLDHLVPFHRPAKPALPTAVQASREAHATESNAAFPPKARPVGSIDQPLPFQPSTSGPPPKPPTAKHPVADQHATPDKPPLAGVDWIIQPLPFHRSASGPLAEPTAKQAPLVGQDTPLSPANLTPLREGRKTAADKVKPFQYAA
jgi:hypothetical protein